MSRIKKDIFRYAGPGILGLVFNSLYIIVDGVFVANMLGSNSLAAVTTVVPVVEILIAISLMVSIGGGIYISLYKGKGDINTSRSYYNHGLILILTFAILISVFSLLFKSSIVKMLGATPEIMGDATEYFTWFIYFVPFFMLNYALGTWIRNDGKPNLAMVGQIVGAVLNIVLDYVFMGPLNMGIKGAAIATGLGPVVGILLVAPHFLLKKGDLYFEKFKFNWSYIKNILIGGLPSFSIEFSLGLTTFFCNIFIAKSMYENGLAAFGVVGYINLMLLSVFLGMGQGTQPLVSKFHGQNNWKAIKEVYKYSILFSVIIGVVGYIVLVFVKSPLISVFIGYENKELFDLTVTATIIFFITLAITGVNVVTASVFEAKQSVTKSIVISLCRSFLFLLPILMLLSRLNHPMLIWLGVPLAELFTLIVSIVLWKREDVNFSGSPSVKKIDAKI